MSETEAMDETEQTLMELDGLKRSITDSYWRAVVEDAIALIKKQALDLQTMTAKVEEASGIWGANSAAIRPANHIMVKLNPRKKP